MVAHDDRVVLVGALGVLRRDDHLGEPGDHPGLLVDGQHDVRLQAAQVQRVERVTEPLRVGRAGRQVEIVVVDLRLHLGLRIRVQQVRRGTARVALDPVARRDPVGHRLQGRPVHGGQVEDAAGLHVLPLEAEGLVELHRRGATDGLDPDRGETFQVRPAGGHRDQLPAQPPPSQIGADQHLEHADVTEQQNVDVREDSALTVGQPVVLGHPADPALARNGHGQIVPDPDVLPRWIIGEINGQHCVDGIHERADLRRRGGPGIPFTHPHPYMVPVTGPAGKCSDRKCAGPVTERGENAPSGPAGPAVFVGRLEHVLHVLLNRVVRQDGVPPGVRLGQVPPVLAQVDTRGQ